MIGVVGLITGFGAFFGSQLYDVHDDHVGCIMLVFEAELIVFHPEFSTSQRKHTFAADDALTGVSCALRHLKNAHSAVRVVG